MEIAIVIVLIGVVGLVAVALLRDQHLRRFDKQLSVIMPTARVVQDLRSIRRQAAQNRWRAFYRFMNYDPGNVYAVPAKFVALGGLAVGLADYHLARWLGFSAALSLFIAVVTGTMVIRGVLGWQLRLFRNRLFRQLPDVVEMVTSTVRAGLPVVEAFRIIARDMPEPTAGQFALVCSEIGFGRSAEEAIGDVYRRTKVTEYGMFAVTLAVQLRSGGSLAETLQTLGETVRQRVALAGRARALAGDVIFSARALSAAPFIIGGGYYLINPRMVDKLFTDPTGRGLLAYALISVLMGILAIRWMIRRGTMI